ILYLISGCALLLFPRIVAVLLPPLREEVGEALVDSLRQHDLHRHEFVARRAGGGIAYALALEAQHLAGARCLGDRELHPPADGWHLDLPAENRLVDRDRHLDQDVVALPTEVLVRPDMDL